MSKLAETLGVPILALLGVNFFSFLLMGLDKLLAKLHMRRIPEKVLLGVSACFAAFGGCLGMWLFHHKVRKPKFYLTLPLFALLQAAALYFFFTTNWASLLN